MKLEFPLKVQNPVFIYDSKQGEFQEVQRFAFKTPKVTKPMDDINDWIFFQVTSLEQEEIELDTIYSIQLQFNSIVHRVKDIYTLLKNYVIDWTKPFNPQNYDYLYIQEGKLLTYIIAFQKQEFINQIMGFIFSQLAFSTKYSEIGLIQQIDDTLDWICYISLKKIIQQIGMIHNVEYVSMLDLTKKILEIKDFQINNLDIQSIIYKTYLSIGLFPYCCELNSMDNNVIYLYTANLLLGSDVVPWSTKYHACLSIGNIRYSFIDDSIFLPQTVRKREYKLKRDYISLKILDFFPLNSWVELVGNFFIENFTQMLKYIQAKLPTLKVEQQNMNIKQSDDEECGSFKSLQKRLLEDSELMEQFDEDKEYLQLFKNLMKESIQHISYEKTFYGITKTIPKINDIKEKISKEFYDNYASELKRQNLLEDTISIITETEMKGYSRFYNNCQTPLAAFIYKICEIYRPYQEILNQKKKIKNASLCIRNSVSDIGTQKKDISQTDQKWINTYCKYASIFDLAMLSQQFILPVSLTHSLDYFGYYSDKLQQEYLDGIKKVDKNINNFHKSYHSKCKRKPYDQICNFENIVNQGIKTGLFSYQNIQMKKLDDVISILQLFSSLDTEKHQDIKFDLHYLIQHYQMQIVNFKKKKVVQKEAKIKHRLQIYLDTVYYFYFNSIRLQLNLKERANTVSQIGFVIVKSEDKVETGQPSNIDLQIIV